MYLLKAYGAALRLPTFLDCDAAEGFYIELNLSSAQMHKKSFISSICFLLIPKPCDGNVLLFEIDLIYIWIC